MCGICGVYHQDGKEIKEETVKAICDQLTHRGPDDWGVTSFPGVSLGARRLAVLDLSQEGHQPMTFKERGLTVTLNGEIYNYPELRKDLEKEGYVFRSKCDTEVLLYAWDKWERNCFKHLRGMFTFALWDEKTKELILARDPLGVKPLFYTSVGKELYYASEAHPLYRLINPTMEDIDPDSLDYFLAFGYTPAQRGFVKGIKKLEPGHFMVLKEGQVHKEAYWKRSFVTDLNLTQEEALEKTEVLLKQALSRRLRSDVPLGCFLSGGVDSSLVTAFAATLSDSPINTFTVGFQDNPPEKDERGLARLLSERYKTKHHELMIETGNLLHLPSIQYHFGEPFADVSVFPTLGICHESKKQITVALSGDGGDESFAGYLNVRAAKMAEDTRKRFPSILLKALAFLAKKKWPYFSQFDYPLNHYILREVQDHYNLINHLNSSARKELYGEGPFCGRSSDPLDQIKKYLKGSEGLSDPEKHMWIDFQGRLPGSYLPKVDILSNMVSLEVRSPFLDQDLVEFASTIPFSMKFLNNQPKGLLRELAKRHLPQELIEAPKRGFAPPLGHWLRKKWRKEVSHYLIQSLGSRELFSKNYLKKLVEEHQGGLVDHTQRLWNLFTLEMWWQVTLDGRKGSLED